MEIIEKTHTLSENELGFLRSLIGKSISSIESDSIMLYPSKPELYSFSNAININLWHCQDTYRLGYEFDETQSGDDFIELRITKGIREKRRLMGNASLMFSGIDNFLVRRIKVYGDSYLAELKSGQQEMVNTENVVVLEGSNGKRICIECLYPYLEVNVTLKEELIEKILWKLTTVYSPAYVVGTVSKHTIE